MSAAAPRAGDRVAGYEILRRIGAGGHGTVYEARQVSLDRWVALKLLHRELAADSALAERFVREAQAQARLDHHHVVGIYDVGVDEGRHYLAMQLVRGADLEALLRVGSIDAAMALQLVAEVAGALDAVHAAGLVHRDVTPRNVLVDGDGRALLGDFGLARGASGAGPSLSRGLEGSLPYLAPELLAGASATPESDRYALAAVAFTCLTGSPPDGRGAPEVRRRLPAEVGVVLAGGMASDPAARPASAAALARALVGAVGERVADLGAPPVRALPARSGAPPARGRRRLRRVLLAAPVAAVALGLLVVARDDDAAPSAAAPTPLPGTVPLGARLDGGAVRDVACGLPGVCSVQLLDSGGRAVRVPADGVIRGWTVRGATGTMALELTRSSARGDLGELLATPVDVPDRGPHRFRVALPVRRGDVLGLELGEGAVAGLRAAPGARVRIWQRALSRTFQDIPLRPADAAAERAGELQLRVDYLRGGSALPRQLLGERAARAPVGETLASRELPPGDSAEVRVVRQGGRIWLDVFRGATRRARLALTAFAPEGRLGIIEIVSNTPGRSGVLVRLVWERPGAGSATANLLVSPSRVEAQT